MIYQRKLLPAYTNTGGLHNTFSNKLHKAKVTEAILAAKCANAAVRIPCKLRSGQVTLANAAAHL